jgi:mono/diheme cytochrome c family protein
MPKLNLSGLGDLIQIVASVGVVAGIAFMIIELAQSTQLTETAQPDLAFETALKKPRRDFLGESTAVITPDRRTELLHFVRENCPACHGMTGGIGPALSKVNLEHLSLNAITFTILYGRPEKGMPAWETQLSEEDTYWIAGLMKRGDITIDPSYRR